MDRNSALAAYLERCREKPFAWGSWDCCQFVGQWVAELTGFDRRGEWPTYSTEEEARQILEASGGLVAMITSKLPRIHPSRAQRGDLVLSAGRGGSALGICAGVNSAHVGANGLEYFRTLDAVAAWRVECGRTIAITTNIDAAGATRDLVEQLPELLRTNSERMVDQMNGRGRE